MTVSRIPNGPGGRKGRGMKRLVFLIVFTLFATASGIAQFAPLTTTTPTVASFTGTYSWQAANLKDLDLPMLLPGIKINTSPNDFYPIQQMQMQRFDGQRWERIGPVMSGDLSGS